jgi:transcriptional regulator with XRE-family HTH domain
VSSVRVPIIRDVVWRVNMETERLLDQISEYAREHGLSMKAAAALLGVPATTYYGWFKEGGNKVLPSRSSIEKIQRFLGESAGESTAPSDPRESHRAALPVGRAGSARETARRVKELLILLENELSTFRDGAPSARDAFRNELDPDDVGYISSLLTMLGDEEKFARWRELTTNRFNRFRKKNREKP